MSLKHIVTFIAIIVQIESEMDRRTITTLKYCKQRVMPTIVNGNVAGSGQVPYIVSIKEPIQKIGKFKLWKNLCGGSIISKLKILTAAHCFENNRFHYYNHPYILRIVAGNLTTNVFYDGVTSNIWNTQWRSIKKVTLHRDFNFPSNDLALIFVDKEWDYTDNVQFILTPRGNQDYPPVCITAGFGSTGHGLRDRASHVLLVGSINLLTKRQCSNLWEMNMDNFVCTTSALSDVSYGDSGGPLMCEDRHGREVLVGVVSGKNFDATSLFTRVAAYRDWLDRNYACNLLKDWTFLILLSLLLLLT